MLKGKNLVLFLKLILPSFGESRTEGNDNFLITLSYSKWLERSLYF
ncbi:MAG: hypothetical protein F6K17_06205 [Okeania sp. SIO3C4]|nr:hypothetical protein [Okeania sp. SIO3B3]NER02248.1 hypothetical protein [Okeania sp. SIO3C4]